MTGRVGATPEQLDHLAQEFANKKDELQSLYATITRQLEGTDWEGQAREKFVADWKGPFTQAIRSIEEGLMACGAEARDRAAKFRAAGY